MYIWRAYQSPCSGTHCADQWAQMPNFASRNQSGHRVLAGQRLPRGLERAARDARPGSRRRGLPDRRGDVSADQGSRPPARRRQSLSLPSVSTSTCDHPRASCGRPRHSRPSESDRTPARPWQIRVRFRPPGLLERHPIDVPCLEAHQPDAIGFGGLHRSVTGLDPGDALAARRPYPDVARDGGSQDPGDGLAVRPRGIDLHVAARPQTTEVAVRPRRRQAREGRRSRRRGSAGASPRFRQRRRDWRRSERPGGSRSAGFRRRSTSRCLHVLARPIAVFQPCPEVRCTTPRTSRGDQRRSAPCARATRARPWPVRAFPARVISSPGNSANRCETWLIPGWARRSPRSIPATGRACRS